MVTRKKKARVKRKPRRKLRLKTAADTKPKRPTNWDKRVSVAYLLTTGSTQVEAANAAGCSERVIRDWKNHGTWPAVVAEAHQRWLSGCDAKVKAAIDRLLTLSNEKVVMWYGDRRIPELQPPKTRTEISGPDGGPLLVTSPDEARQKLLDKLAGK